MNLFEATSPAALAADRERARRWAEEAALYEDMPDCDCGWSGKGTGPGGRFIRGDRCPQCGEVLG